MEQLRVFSIITLIVIIASGTNTISFLSADGKFDFSISLLQTTSAQEQEEQKAEQQQEEGVGEEQQDDEIDSDAVMEKEQEQDEAESEIEPSTEEQQQESSQEERLQQEEGGEEQIKADCGPGEHFDSEVDLCIPDQEKVCDDDKDNDYDSRVDSKDSDCLPTKNEQEHEEEANLNDHANEAKLSQEEGGGMADLNNEEGNSTKTNPITLEQRSNNISSINSTSPSNYGTIDRVSQNNQNLTNNGSTTVGTINNTNNTLSNGSQSHSNSSAVEGNLVLTCSPYDITMVPGAQATLSCILENKGDKPENLVIDCSGLQNSGIECYVDGQHLTKRSLINPTSHIDFSILLVSQSVPPTAAGTYSFDIGVVKCLNSDRC